MHHVFLFVPKGLKSHHYWFIGEPIKEHSASSVITLEFLLQNYCVDSISYLRCSHDRLKLSWSKFHIKLGGESV